ncbi:hypothetical protein D0B54_17925 [Solimonas sp. K1W22B-7]|uniref:hypothetical protein n=1 Tax=Solimonas sp. K1W22B-7 TaxID=2303331 RepID=UPI000E32E893|nr:hypothetical protein [Solimonas sp. K1W22B-7]AXQ30439.1 hypothetical protein D0B54_17925 [Solimonas sp. K1W22B-7]
MLQPADIRREWPRIAAQVAAILQGDEETPEEVYAECRFGRAQLYRSADGFVVLKKYPREDTGRPELLLWLAHGEGGRDLLRQYQPQLIDIARAVGAATLAFRSRRRGFERLLDERWQLRAVEYQLKI